MPTFWGVGGTAITSRTETALLTGTATGEVTPTVYVSGTGTVDRASLAAWAAQIRRTATRVLLGDGAEDIVRLRDAVTVNVNSDSPVATAAFRVTDSRCAYHAADSIATGGLAVSVRVRIETDAARADTLVFQGLTEGATNEDPYTPTAAIQCGGSGSEWLDSVGCIALAAFGGYSRLDVLKAFAEAAGVDPDRIVGGAGSALVYLGLDLSGLSVWELARRFAEIEDWYVRVSGVTLELLPAADAVGPAAAPIFGFTPSNYFSVREDPPTRPTTRYILSTVGIPEEIFTGGEAEVTTAIQGGTTAGGIKWETRVITTTYNQVVVSERIEEWQDAAIPGVTPSDVAWRLWRLTEVETDWLTVDVDGVSLRTGRLLEQRTTVHEFYSAPCRTADGYVWTDGTRHVDGLAYWQITSTSLTTYTYEDAPSCLLSSKVTLNGGWYSPLSVGGETYDDGAVRLGTQYLWTAETDVPPFSSVEETYTEDKTDTVSAVESTTSTLGWHLPPGSSILTEEWSEVSGSSTRWSTSTGSGIVTEATSTTNSDGSTEYASKSYAGALPALQRASADIPQYRTVPYVLTATANGDRYLLTQQTETIFDAESLDELERVARRRFREQLSPRVTILHPALPLLKLFDVVTVTDPARELDEKRGYVAAYNLTLDALNGGLRQETTVVFPLPEYNPEAA